MYFPEPTAEEILERIQDDWALAGDEQLKLVLQKCETESGNPLIRVYAKNEANRTSLFLFSAAHFPDRPYPATIGEMRGESSLLAGMKADTAVEFRTLIDRVLSDPIVKADLDYLRSSQVQSHTEVSL